MWGFLIGYVLGKSDAENNKNSVKEEVKLKSLGWFEPTEDDKKKFRTKFILLSLLSLITVGFVVYLGFNLYSYEETDSISYLFRGIMKFFYPVMAFITSVFIGGSSLVLLTEFKDIYVKNRIERFGRVDVTETTTEKY